MITTVPTALLARALDITTSIHSVIVVILHALDIDRLIILIRSGTSLLPSSITATGTIQDVVVSVHNLANPNAEAEDDKTKHAEGPTADEPDILVHLGGRQEGELQPLEDVRTAHGRGHPARKELVGQRLPLMLLHVGVVTHLIDGRLHLIILLVAVMMVLLLAALVLAAVLAITAQRVIGSFVHNTTSRRRDMLLIVLLVAKMAVMALYAKRDDGTEKMAQEVLVDMRM